MKHNTIAQFQLDPHCLVHTIQITAHASSAKLLGIAEIWRLGKLL